ncbi:Serine protease inhibitor 3/4 [Thelohanellus kitauei]|nr:Serine protease inhibitor 3/4 [Thelohanellus kitauei]
MALEVYDFQLQSIDATNNDRQINTINEWAQQLQDVPFRDIFIQPFKDHLSLLIINEYFIRFQWKRQFIERAASVRSFTNIDSNTKQFVMMRRIEYMKYINDKDMKASVVFVPLEENDMYAAVVLPFDDQNVLDLLKRMNVRVL